MDATTEMGLRELLARLDNGGISWWLAMNDGNYSHVVARESDDSEFSAWFLIEPDGDTVMVDDDFAELWSL